MAAGGAGEASPKRDSSHGTPHVEDQTSQDTAADEFQKRQEGEDASNASDPPLPQEPLPSNPPAHASSQIEPRQTSKSSREEEKEVQPPLPDEEAPPLPNEPVPAATDNDDGWQPVWDASANAYYFYNRFTQASQWQNPRVPNTQSRSDHERIEQPQYAPGTEPAPKPAAKTGAAGGYNPAIHGDYDPNADYAVLQNKQEDELGAPPGLPSNPEGNYASTAAFNRFTGRFNNTELHPTHTPEQHSDEAKARRQMSAFFDVDAAANAHGGRSLKAERQERKLSKKELQQFQARRRARKEEKRRAWLRD